MRGDRRSEEPAEKKGGEKKETQTIGKKAGVVSLPSRERVFRLDRSEGDGKKRECPERTLQKGETR